jgi:hypothetical protein
MIGNLLILCAGTIFFIFTTMLCAVGEVEKYSQAPAIDFYMERQGEDCYIYPMEKSYAHYFYSDRQPRNRCADREWLTTGDIDKPCYFAFTNDTSGEIAAVGNTFKLVNGAEFSQSSMYMNPSCASNMIFVGSGSAIKTKGDLNIRGTDNRVVVSNGTLYVSQSGNSMRFGKSASDVSEKGNTLVLKGENPKVARIDPNNNYPSQFWNGSVLRFEVPANGYSDVVFDRVEVKLHGTARLEFSGVEKCSYTIAASQDYQLSSSAFTVLDENGEDVTTAYLEQVSAELPPRCRVYRNASKYLYLRVACRRGTRLILR